MSDNGRDAKPILDFLKVRGVGFAIRKHFVHGVETLKYAIGNSLFPV